MRFSFTAPLWEWSAQGGWFFVTLPTDAADDIAEVDRAERGFGSVRVQATVGALHYAAPDPYGGTREEYEACARLIARLVRATAERLARELEG